MSRILEKKNKTICCEIKTILYGLIIKMFFFCTGNFVCCKNKMFWLSCVVNNLLTSLIDFLVEESLGPLL